VALSLMILDILNSDFVIKAQAPWLGPCADLPPGVTGVRARADIQI
jgi:hypothetical protein